MEFVFENIDELKTPVGSFIVNHGQNRISFSVKVADLHSPYEVTDDNNKIIGLIKADKCFDIFINTDNLVVGSDYNISFLNGKWSYCAGGENTVCVNTVIGDLVVGIGAYDPNEFNDKSDYIYYTVEVLNNYNGFSFRLLDRELKYLKFCVATAKIEQYPSIVYEDAVGYWLT